MTCRTICTRRPLWSRLTARVRAWRLRAEIEALGNEHEHWDEMVNIGPGMRAGIALKLERAKQRLKQLEQS